MTLNSGCFDFFIPFPLFFISPGPTLEIGGMGSFFDAYFIEKKLSLAKRNKKKELHSVPKISIPTSYQLQMSPCQQENRKGPDPCQ